MLSLIQVLLLAIKIYTWIIIGAAIFSWLYAFNVVNPRNQFIAMIGNALFFLQQLIVNNLVPLIL